MNSDIASEFKKIYRILQCKVSCNFLNGTYSLPEFADNTAAKTGGLVVGNLYHTSGIVKIVI